MALYYPTIDMGRILVLAESAGAFALLRITPSENNQIIIICWGWPDV
jgi:hypothetical protein